MNILYNIIINQASIIANGFNVKGNHIGVLEVVICFINSGQCEQIRNQHGDWYWVSHELIIGQLPLFDIGKSRCKQLIQELCKEGLLELNPTNQGRQRVYMRIGPRYKDYKYFDPEKAKNYPLVSEPNTKDKKLSSPKTKNYLVQGQKIVYDNSTNENSTDDNNRESEAASPALSEKNSEPIVNPQVDNEDFFPKQPAASHPVARPLPSSPPRYPAMNVRSGFVEPTLAEITVELTVKTTWNADKIKLVATKFFNHYRSNGWENGKMICWRSKLDTWTITERNESTQSNTRSGSGYTPAQQGATAIIPEGKRDYGSFRTGH